MTIIEVLAVALGLANVFLIVRRSVWNFPFGIAMVSIYAWIFFTSKLYGEAGLQVFFFVIQFYGWWKWTRAIGDEGTLNVRWSPPATMLGWLAVTVVLALGLGTALDRWTDAVAPYPDATVAAASIVAQILLSIRRIENWIYWIAVDILSVWLFITRDLLLTAGLYAVFLVLASAGLYAWRKAGQARQREELRA